MIDYEVKEKRFITKTMLNQILIEHIKNMSK